jgi:hypothetical protein
MWDNRRIASDPMAGTYNLELSLFGVFSADSPMLEIWEDGSLFNSYSIASSGTSL